MGKRAWPDRAKRDARRVLEYTLFAIGFAFIYFREFSPAIAEFMRSNLLIWKYGFALFYALLHLVSACVVLLFVLSFQIIGNMIMQRRYWARFACLFAVIWETGHYLFETYTLSIHGEGFPLWGFVLYIASWPSVLYWVLDTLTARGVRLGWRTPAEIDHPVLRRLENARIRKSMSQERFANEVIRVPYATYDRWLKGGLSKVSAERLQELEKLASQLEAELGDKGDMNKDNQLSKKAVGG